jgi:hypothetical protein
MISKKKERGNSMDSFVFQEVHKTVQWTLTYDAQFFFLFCCCCCSRFFSYVLTSFRGKRTCYTPG